MNKPTEETLVEYGFRVSGLAFREFSDLDHQRLSHLQTLIEDAGESESIRIEITQPEQGEGHRVSVRMAQQLVALSDVSRIDAAVHALGRGAIEGVPMVFTYDGVEGVDFVGADAQAIQFARQRYHAGKIIEHLMSLNAIDESARQRMVGTIEAMADTTRNNTRVLGLDHPGGKPVSFRIEGDERRAMDILVRYLRALESGVQPVPGLPKSAQFQLLWVEDTVSLSEHIANSGHCDLTRAVLEDLDREKVA